MTTPTKKPKNFDDLYPGRFLKAGNFDGKKVTLTIKDVATESLEGEDGAKLKAIVHFAETDRALVACKTNGLCIREMFGASLAGWVGKRITLYPAEWNGEPCIRVFGSPDIERDMRVEIKLPRRKPFGMTLAKTPSKADQSAASQAGEG